LITALPHVQVPQPHLRQPRGQLLQHGHRHDRRAVIALGQGRQVGLVEQGRAQQRDPDRGWGEEAGDAVARHQRQQVVRHRFAGDDVGRADVDGRPEEHVELGTVVQRERMQGQVVLGNLGVDDAADVLPQHRVVREHGAFGHRFGAAGVDDLGQVGARQAHFGQGVGAGRQFVEAGHARCGLAGVLGGQPDEVLHRSIQGCGGTRQFSQAAVGGQRAGARMTQDVGHLVGLEHEVDRHQHCAQPRQRKAQGGKPVRVARQHRHAVALAHPTPGQPGGQARDQGVELGKGPGRIATDDGGLGGQTQRGAAQGVRDGLAADRRAHGVSCGWRVPGTPLYRGPLASQAEDSRSAGCFELRRFWVQFVTN
jgi:hypothetical protein